MRRLSREAFWPGAGGLALVLITACASSSGARPQELAAAIPVGGGLTLANQATAEAILTQVPTPGVRNSPTPELTPVRHEPPAPAGPSATPTPQPMPRVTAAQRHVTIAETKGWGATPGFAPNDFTVSVGSWVTWSNVGAAIHHVVAANGVFDSGDLPPKSGLQLVCRRARNHRVRLYATRVDARPGPCGELICRHWFE